MSKTDSNEPTMTTTALMKLATARTMVERHRRTGKDVAAAVKAIHDFRRAWLPGVSGGFWAAKAKVLEAV